MDDDDGARVTMSWLWMAACLGVLLLMLAA